MSSEERNLGLDEEIGYRIRGDDTDAFLEEYRDGRWYEAREPLGPRPEPTVAEVLLCAKAQELAAEVAQLRQALSRLITATSNLSVGADAEWHRDPGTVEWREAFHAARAALGVSRPGQEQETPLFTRDDLSVELRGGMRMRDPSDGQEQEGQ